MASCLQVEDLTKSFGDLVLFENLSFGIDEGQKIGLIAPNGTGKTTLLSVLSGKEGYDSGRIVFRKDLRVGYLPQEPYFPAGLTVLEVCLRSDNPVLKLVSDYEKALLHNDIAALEALMSRMDAERAWDYDNKIKQILSQLKITDFNQPVEQLSGGLLKRVALANVLIAEPELLILDEPTNHLDLDMTEWLEEYLQRSRLSLLMVTHDRYFLDRVCNEIMEIDRKQLYHYKGNYSYYLEKRQERIAAHNAEIDRANNLLRKELDWMRRQPQARGTKARYRIDAFYELEEKARRQREQQNVQLNVKASYIGSKIFELKGLSKCFGEQKIVENFHYTFARYEKMGIVGNNGTGKSTFVKMLMGEILPDSGTIDIGETVRFGYYSQSGLQFDENMRVIDAVTRIAEDISLGEGNRMSASQFLQHFLFTPETQYNYIRKLSGGEKRRLYLCTILIGNPNFLILDEPTNDLDIVTLNVLEEYLRTFKGCVIVVSHDRYFMDKVVDHLLVFEGNGRIKDFPGNYSDYRAWKALQAVAGNQESSAVKKTGEVKPDRKNRPEEKKRKLTFKEKCEFEELDKNIPEWEQEKKEIEQQLSSGQLSAEELMEKSVRIKELMDLLDEKTMRWLELSEWM